MNLRRYRAEIATVGRAPITGSRRITASCPAYDLELLVAWSENLQGAFRALDLDTGEYITVKGWMFEIGEGC